MIDPQPNHLLLDVYPARITTSNTLIHPESRIIVGDSDYYVFTEATTGPVLTETGPYADFTRDFSAGHTLTLENGDVYTISKAGGCGCGSRLKSFHPFFGVPFAK